MNPKTRCPVCGMGVMIMGGKIRRHCRFDGPWCEAGGKTMKEVLQRLFK